MSAMDEQEVLRHQLASLQEQLAAQQVYISALVEVQDLQQPAWLHTTPLRAPEAEQADSAMLSHGLSDPEPAVRLEVLLDLSEALGADELSLGEGTALGLRLRQEGAVGRLVSMLQSESDLEVQKMVVWILGNLCSDTVDLNSRETKHMLFSERESACASPPIPSSPHLFLSVKPTSHACNLFALLTYGSPSP